MESNAGARAGVSLERELLARHVTRFGGDLSGAGALVVSRVEPIDVASEGAIAPLFSSRHAHHARSAALRGAVLLVDRALLSRPDVRDAVAEAPAAWVHAHALWAFASLLDTATLRPEPPQLGLGTTISEHVVLYPGVSIGKRVQIGPGSVVGRPGFGWATGPSGEVRAVPQLGGVVIEDDVVIGALSTIDAGTLSPTIIRRGAKLDAHCHVGHNCDIGENVIVAAQSGFAGSVRVGRFTLIGGQVGVADHVTIGERAKIAAKSGVIGDVPDGATVAGYPAVDRWRWLRGMAQLYGRRDRARGGP